jgi:hypothetical protein
MVMNRLWGHVLAALSFAAAGGAAIAACMHDDSTIFIQDVLAPQEVTEGTQCVFTASPTQVSITSGTLDLSLRHFEYVAWFLVGNQMVAEANGQQLMTETSIVNIQGAVVRVTDSAGTQLTTFTRDAAGSVYPATGNVPGYAPIGVQILDTQTLATNPEIQSKVTNPSLSPLGRGVVRLITYTRVFGHTLGGDYVESNEFEFPVDVCYGCLIGSRVNCKAGAGSATTVPCYPGQDLVVDFGFVFGSCDAGTGG